MASGPQTRFGARLWFPDPSAVLEVEGRRPHVKWHRVPLGKCGERTVLTRDHSRSLGRKDVEVSGPLARRWGWARVGGPDVADFRGRAVRVHRAQGC